MSRSLVVAVAACLVLAAVSLAAPSTPSYDPWAWIAWGREIVHLDLNTRLGPSWKPLPVMFTTLFGPTGDAAPSLWLVVARAGGLLALVMAFRVAHRLAGGTAGWVAGAIAALALATSADFARTVAFGYSEGMLVALVLGGVEAHLRGHPRAALWLAFGAALLRPEVWPFAAAYALLVWIRDPDRRRQIAALAVAVPALWFLPELWGSGDALRASSRAQEAVGNAPALADEPAKELLRRARWVLIAPVEAGVLLAVAFGAVALARAREWTRGYVVELVLAATAVAWLALVAIMTERGYAGNERYLMAPIALGCVLAGIGWARAGELVARVLARGGGVRQAATTLAAVALFAVALAIGHNATSARVDELGIDVDELDFQAQIHDDLGRVIERAGGRERVVDCGPVATGNYRVPAVAWQLHLHGEQVGVKAEPTGSVLISPAVAKFAPTPPRPPTYRTVARAGRWEVAMRCGGP